MYKFVNIRYISAHVFAMFDDSRLHNGGQAAFGLIFKISGLIFKILDLYLRLFTYI